MVSVESTVSLTTFFMKVFWAIPSVSLDVSQKEKYFGNNPPKKKILFKYKILNKKLIKWQYIHMLFSDLETCSLYRILMSFQIGNNDVIVILYG